MAHQQNQNRPGSPMSEASFRSADAAQVRSFASWLLGLPGVAFSRATSLLGQYVTSHPSAAAIGTLPQQHPEPREAVAPAPPLPPADMPYINSPLPPLPREPPPGASPAAAAIHAERIRLQDLRDNGSLAVGNTHRPSIIYNMAPYAHPPSIGTSLPTHNDAMANMPPMVPRTLPQDPMAPGPVPGLNGPLGPAFAAVVSNPPAGAGAGTGPFDPNAPATAGQMQTTLNVITNGQAANNNASQLLSEQLTDVRNTQTDLRELMQQASPGGTPAPFMPASSHGDASGHAASRVLPRPPTLSGDSRHDSKLVADHEVWYDTVTAYLRPHNMSLVGHLQFFLQGKAARWFHSLKLAYAHKGRMLTDSLLRDEFLRTYRNPLLNHDEHEARMRLDSPEAMQLPGQPVADYVQRFRTILLDAPSMAPADQVYYFMRNMCPPLAKQCATTNDKRHTTLEQAIDAAYAAEFRWKAAKASVSVAAAHTHTPAPAAAVPLVHPEPVLAFAKMGPRKHSFKHGKHSSRPQKYHSTAFTRKSQVLREMREARTGGGGGGWHTIGGNAGAGPSGNGKRPADGPANPRVPIAPGSPAPTSEEMRALGLCTKCAAEGFRTRYGLCPVHNPRVAKRG